MSLFDGRDMRVRRTVCGLFIAVLVAGAIVHVRLWKTDTKGEDVYYAWVEGTRILDGQNPYARVLDGDMRVNQKYATYFPVFYELSALTQLAGRRDYESWIAFWRVVFLLFNLGTAVLLFHAGHRRRMALLGLLAACFWLFNRWTLLVTRIAHLDFIPIFFLIAALELFPRNRWMALLLFGLSLGVKQIAIFVTPLFLIWCWQAGGPHRFRQIGLAALAIAAIPLLASAPFLAWNAEGFVKSVLFSATREGASHFAGASMDGWLGWVGIPAKLPMLGLMALTCGLAGQRRIGTYVATLLIMAIFLDFNSVLFVQYMAWIVPLIPLVACDLADERRGVPA
jgi:uncharacterized membrane protein